MVIDIAGLRNVAAHYTGKVYREMGHAAIIGTQDLRTAAEATDAWIESNQASFNTALPETFRTTATLEEKTLMFVYVAMKRAGLI